MERNTALLTATVAFVVLAAASACFWFYYMLECDEYTTRLKTERVEIEKLESEWSMKNRMLRTDTDSLNNKLKDLERKNAALRQEIEDNIHRSRQARNDAHDKISLVEPAVRDVFHTTNRELDEIQREDDLLARAEAGFKKEKAELEREIGRVEKELKRKKSEIESQEADLQAEIQQVKRDLAEVQQKLKLLRERGELEKKLEEDGKIIAVGKGGTNYVSINLGWADGVRKGMKFDVYEERGSGVKIRKAKVELVGVHASTSDCTVLPHLRRRPVCPQCGWEAYREDMRYCIYCALGDNNDEVQNLDRRVIATIVAKKNPFNPIVPGDKISNPFYYQGRQMKFVFAGDPVRRSRREIRLFIQENNSILEDQITHESDYLIVGTGPRVPAMLEEARKKGVKIMQEEELYEFFGRPTE